MSSRAGYVRPVNYLSRPKTMAMVSGAYVVSMVIGLAWLKLGPTTHSLLWDSLIADLVMTVVVFVFSRALKNSSFYDAYWTVIPVFFLAYWIAERSPEASTARIVCVSVVVIAWSVRLTSNWARFYPGHPHEDWRYPMLREKHPKIEFWTDLMGIHVVPTLCVFAGMLPMYAAICLPGRAFGVVDVLATVLGLACVYLSLAADKQLRDFAATKKPGEALKHGLWGLSRHPNYLGEIGFWVSLMIFGFAALTAWWLPLGAVTMIALFFGASIPMMEERSLERRPEYQEVIDTVPKLVPFPRRR